MPWFSSRLLWLAADPARRTYQLGDLAEEYQDRAVRDLAAARRWYRRQALLSIRPNVTYRVQRLTRFIRRNQGDGMMWTVLQDLKLTLRTARNSLAFSAVIVLTLGLGIGATTTMFSMVYGLVLNPFPFPEPDRIVGIGTAYPRLGSGLGFFENMSPLEFTELREESATLEEVVAWDMGNRQIDTEGAPENVFSAFWWGDALQTLGMNAHLGRGFSDAEITEGANVVMLGESTWRNRFGADSTMIGEALSVNGSPYVLIGVFPAGVDLYGTQLWMTMGGAAPEMFARNRRQFQTMARIADGSSLDEVNAELEGLARRTEREHAAEFEEYQGWEMRALTWNEVSSQFYRTGLLILLGAVGFVLLLVCANTANLLLARAQGRKREMAVRMAMGAGRLRIISQLLTESVALAAVGGALGVALAFAGVRGITGFLNTVGVNVAGSIEINLPVLGFTAAVAVGAGVLFGLAPALQTSQLGIGSALKSDGKGATSAASHQRLQRGLVGLEVALAFVLLAGGGLLVNSFIRVNRVDPGFEMDDVLTARLTLPREEYEGQAGPEFFRELTERLEGLPGVIRASAGTQFPPIAFAFRQIFFDGAEADAEATLPSTITTIVRPGYFGALGIPLLRGRVFDDRDADGAPLAVIINEETAERYFPDGEAIGRRLKVGSSDATEPWWEIVGVVGSTRNLGLDQDPFPEVFAVHEQVGGAQNQLFLIMRTAVEPHSLVAAVRETVLQMDADQPVYRIQTIDEAYQAGVAPMRATTLMLSIFGAFALMLAAVGIYSVVSFTVGERTQEIGVRVALGADPARVRRLVVRQSIVPVALGAIVGVAAAIAMSGGLQQVLFDVTGTDPLTLSTVAALLMLVALAASWLPAFRAARMDPVEALRAK